MFDPNSEDLSVSGPSARSVVTGGGAQQPAPSAAPPDDGYPMTGAPVSRVDGLVKVTGAARYAAEVPVENVAHGALVKSRVASGRIRNIDTAEAEAAPGVIAVLTHENAPTLNTPSTFTQPLPILQDDKIRYGGQSIGVVVAERLEQAEHAAKLVQVEYDAEDPQGSFEAQMSEAFVPEGQQEQLHTRRGDLDAGRQAADTLIEHDYETPIEHHNPMEPHATVAVWNENATGDEPRLTVYDATQGVTWAQRALAGVFGLRPEEVHVTSRFLGGGFGCKGGTWPHVMLTALAARETGRPVKLALSRTQMFTSVGHRAPTRQRITFGAKKSGELTLHRHEATSHTSTFGMYVEQTGKVPKMLYACPNQEVVQRVVRLNVGTPTFMRAPGEASGSFGLESAIDELAHELGMDPIELRNANYADADPQTGDPWSSKSLRACYERGAEAFGWNRRSPEPRSTREGHRLVGYGTSSATYPTYSRPAAARVSIRPDGSVLVQSGTQDIGTGTYTIMSQVAAQALGVPVEAVTAELGDSTLPEAPGSGGSVSAASVSGAVDAAARKLRQQIVETAVEDDASPLAGLRTEDVRADDGRVYVWNDHGRGEEIAQIMQRRGEELTAEVRTTPGEEGYAKHSFGANFCEVHVDEALGEVRVARFHSVYGAGRILNEKTARSQFQGGIIWGIGMALMEETALDPRFARYVGATFADYHVPTHADIRNVTVDWVEEEDPHINPLGVKGIGELGIVGVAGAVANAIFNATGKRIRTLPLTPDKIINATPEAPARSS